MNFSYLKIEEKIIYILLLIFPIISIFSIFASDLISSTIGMTFLIYCIRCKVGKYLLNKISFIVYIFLFYLIIRSIFSIDPMLSLESSLFYFRHWIFVCTIWFILEKNINFLKYFLLMIFLSLFLLFIDSFFQFFNSKNIFGYPYNGERIASFFKDEFILGGFVSRLILLLLAIIAIVFNNNNKKILILSLLVFFITFNIIILSGDRIAIIYFVYSLLLFTIFAKINLFYKFYSILFFIILVSFFLFLFEDIYTRMILISIKQLYVEINDIEGNFIRNKFVIYSPFITDILHTSFNIFKDNYIFGIGPKLFRVYCLEEVYLIADGCSTHPHNFISQYLVELGIVGLLMIFTFVFYLIKSSYKQLIYYFNDDNNFNLSKFYLGMLILINLIPLWPTGNFFNNFGSIQLSLPIGFYLFFHFNNKSLSKFNN